MRLEIDVAMDYQLAGDETVLLTLEAAQEPGQIVHHGALEIANATLHRIDGEGGWGQRVWANVTGDRLNLRYRASVEVIRADIALATLRQIPIQELPPEVVTYLRPSRFCPSDMFVPYASRTFGHLEAGAKIAAIRDWVAEAISYAPGSSIATTSASDTFLSREGVCRDYAHLICCLARASRIPARYTAGYSTHVTPPDFHAVAEVWLEGGWHQVDATGMSTPSGLVMIGSGRDAGDVAFMETIGLAYPISHTVSVWESKDALPDT